MAQRHRFESPGHGRGAESVGNGCGDGQCLDRPAQGADFFTQSERFGEEFAQPRVGALCFVRGHNCHTKPVDRDLGQPTVTQRTSVTQRLVLK